MTLAFATGDAFHPMPLENATVVGGVCFEMSQYEIGWLGECAQSC